jgi:AcrR family transcriptional regulator
MTSAYAAPTSGPSLRQRIVLAAIETTSSGGWSAVTMGGVADRVGVSRQTVYNEVGSKPALAEAVVAHEFAGFLSLVELAFDAHPADPVAAVHHAALGVLVRAEENELLRAVVSATQGGDTELLPLLTTNSIALIDSATSIVTDRLALAVPRLSPDRPALTADVIVRTVLSHVMQPTRSAERTAADIAEAARLLLA